MRILVKNLGRVMPESVVREKLKSLDIHVQRVTQLRSCLRDQDPAQDRPITSHFILSVAWGPEWSKVRSITELCGLRVSVETYVLQRAHCNATAASAAAKQRNCGYAPRCVACGGSHLSDVCRTPREQPQCCGCELTTRRTTAAVLSGKGEGGSFKAGAQGSS